MKIRYRLLVPFASVLLALLAGCAASSSPVAVSAETRSVLAPSGKLRVGLYPGSPTSLIGDPATGQARGVAFDLGGELAKRLGVPFEPVVFSKNADVLAAVKAGQVDIVFTNATAERAKDMDFSSPFLYVEKGFLVPAGSTMKGHADVDGPGIRVGVSQGSSTERELAGHFKHAAMKRVTTLKAAVQMLGAGELDAFATNKAILFEMSDQLPGSRVLEGRWGMEQFAVARPKGRDQAAFVEQFLATAKSQGQVSQAVQRAGLRGTVIPDSN